MEFEINAAYVLGLVSIILALSFMSPLGGLIAGVIGYNISKKSKTDLGKKAKKLNKIGIIISVIILVIVIGFLVYSLSQGLQTTTRAFSY